MYSRLKFRFVEVEISVCRQNRGAPGGRRRGKRLKVVASGRTTQAFSTSESYHIC